MDQPARESVAKAAAFANGLRKNVTAAGRRWAQWPGGAKNLAAVIASIDDIIQRLAAAATAPDGEAQAAACISELRAVLEWTTYQSASVATARALLVARKTRAFAERFGLLDDPAARLSVLVDSEESLIENVRVKNDYMQMLAERHPQIGFPAPLVTMDSLAPKAEKKPGRLELIQQLKKAAKKT